MCLLIRKVLLYFFTVSKHYKHKITYLKYQSLESMSKTKKLNAGERISRFTEFFDKDFKKSRSALRRTIQDDKSYDASVSWDGRSDNPQAFARLQATNMPTQPTRPITISGGAVVPLEPHDGLPVFGSYTGNGKCGIPLTVEQRDLKMKTNLKGDVPMRNEAQAENKVICVDACVAFRNMEMRSPRFSKVDPPAFLEEVGPQTDKKLMTPAQRSELLDFEIRQREAKEYMRKATADRQRTKKQISGIQYHRGVLMYDSTANKDSEAYGDKSKKLYSTMDRLDRFHDKRQNYLGNVSGKSVATVLDCSGKSDNIMLATVKDFQSKAGHNSSQSFENTFNTLFGNVEIHNNPTRTQYLRNQELSGKNYNISTHTAIEHWPSEPFKRGENKVLSHPSQSCLEGQRSLQGSLRPY